MASLRRALLITFASNNGATAVNFGVSIVLARLLSPHEIGVFSITMVLISIAHIFRDFGVVSYLLREKELTPEKIRAASGVLLFSSWGIALLLYLISPATAIYFNEAGVEPVMQVLALGFVFIPVGAVTYALMTREYRAREQANIMVAGTSAYAFSAILLAYLDFGYMSMAWANLINIIVTGLASSPYRPAYAPWLPSLKGWRKVMHFGAGSVLSNTVSAINNAFSDLFLGKVSNAHNVALFSRANGTANIFMQVAGATVNYAALTHLAQSFHSQGHMTPQLSKASAYLSVLAWPALGVTALFAQPLIIFLYGNQWLECIPIVPLTCALVAVGLSVHFLGIALTASGRPYFAVIPNLILLGARLLCLFVAYDGSLYSFALGMLYGSLLSIPFYLSIQTRFLNFPLKTYFGAHTASSLVTLATLGVGVVLRLLLPDSLAPGLVLLLAFCCCLPTWLLCVWLCKHPFLDELIALRQNMRRARPQRA